MGNARQNSEVLKIQSWNFPPDDDEAAWGLNAGNDSQEKQRTMHGGADSQPIQGRHEDVERRSRVRINPAIGTERRNREMLDGCQIGKNQDLRGEEVANI